MKAAFNGRFGEQNMRDEQILRKMRSGDPIGLEKLMDRYIPYVSAVVWGILRFAMTAEDAEEVVSDVFLAAWEQCGDIQPGKTKAWLGAVARNMSKNKLRHLGCELPLEEDVLEIPGDDTPDAQLEREEEAKLVRSAVDRLGEPDREVFLRHYFHAQTVEEISHAMSLNESTVKTKLRRGRMRLKTILMRWGAV